MKPADQVSQSQSTTDSSLDHRYVYAAFGVLAVACIAGIWFVSPATAKALSEEDGLVQTLSAAFWLGGVACCVVAIRRHHFVRFAWLWLVLCILFLGEETSWFQRYLGYHVPAVEQVSTQSEFNIHNLDAWVHGLPQTAFMLGMLVYFLLAPLAAATARGRSALARIAFPDPTVALGLALWIPVAMSYIPVGDTEIHHAEVETREMLCAFFAMIYTFALAVNHRGVFAAWRPFERTASSIMSPGTNTARTLVAQDHGASNR